MPMSDTPIAATQKRRSPLRLSRATYGTMIGSSTSS